jgi:hydrogenase expression/formation protein HypE
VKESKITMNHGSGGGASRELVESMFGKYFSNPLLDRMDDSAVLNIQGNKLAFTTDSFVVRPIFFNGGDIGKLAICGTVNDLAVMGAHPIAVTAAFILEEGLEISILERIVKSMSETANEAGVSIVAGDTKVVERGNADKIYINTSGIGIIPEGINIGGAMAKAGDVIIVSGPIGNHGASIITAREEMGFKTFVQSDVSPLSGLVTSMINVSGEIHVMRDATRGGLATVLNEIAIQSKVSLEVDESSIPIENAVKGVCELLGLDPFYMANEGRIVVFVAEKDAPMLLTEMKKNPYGKEASIIGRVVDNASIPMVILKTIGRGSRILDILAGEPLPRIC